MKVIGIQAESLGGSFHEMAAIEYYGQDLSINALAPVQDHLELVERFVTPDSDLDEIVIAVDNSTSGRVISAVEALRKHASRISVTGCITIPVQQQLLAHPDTPIDSITQVLSQKPALDQCEQNIRNSWFSTSQHPDTLGAAQLVLANRGVIGGRKTAAIASALAAESTGLRVLNPQFNDNPDNATKFWIIRSASAEQVAGERTALTFEVPNRAGSLLEAVAILSANGRVNLTDIDSHLSPLRKGSRGFFAEIEQRNRSLKRSINALENAGYAPTILGSYTPIHPMEVAQPNGAMPPALRHDVWRGREGLRHPKGSKTLYIETDHEPGALFKVLGHLSEVDLIDLGRPVVPKDKHFNRGFYIVIPPRTGKRRLNSAISGLHSAGYEVKEL